jgi:hypothetical protein
MDPLLPMLIPMLLDVTNTTQVADTHSLPLLSIPMQVENTLRILTGAYSVHPLVALVNNAAVFEGDAI